MISRTAGTAPLLPTLQFLDLGVTFDLLVSRFEVMSLNNGQARRDDYNTINGPPLYFFPFWRHYFWGRNKPCRRPLVLEYMSRMAVAS